MGTVDICAGGALEQGNCSLQVGQPSRLEQHRISGSHRSTCSSLLLLLPAILQGGVALVVGSKMPRYQEMYTLRIQMRGAPKGRHVRQLCCCCKGTRVCSDVDGRLCTLSPCSQLLDCHIAPAACFSTASNLALDGRAGCLFCLLRAWRDPLCGIPSGPSLWAHSRRQCAQRCLLAAFA